MIARRLRHYRGSKGWLAAILFVSVVDLLLEVVR